MDDRAGGRPTFSILTPVFDPPQAAFHECVESVLDQTFSSWELCLVDDRSTEAWVAPALEQLARRDGRIKVSSRSVNGGISAASNDALAMASGEFVVLLDHDDVLAPIALGAVNHYLAREPTADYVYSDEDKIDVDGSLFGRFRKPTWSPERFLCQNYCCHISAIRRDLLVDVGGFRSEFDGAQDWDVVLRVTERARTIVHIPEVLYHWRVLEGSTAKDVDAKPYAVAAGQRAVADALARRGVDAEVVDVGHGYDRVRRRLSAEPLVSVIIPTRGTAGRVWGLDVPYVVNAVNSIGASTYPNIEILVVYDTPTPQATLDVLERRGPHPVRLLHYDKPFNFSEKCNTGALAARGDVLLFLNDDVEVLTPNWIEALIGFLEDPTVGLTGPLLLLDNYLIQSAGHISAPPANFGFRLPPTAGGGGGRPLDLNREVSGVTGACMAMRRETFAEVGGFSVDFPLNYNDVDLCFKLLDAGYRIIWTPDATLFHFESKSRDTAVSGVESKMIENLWGRRTRHDEYLPEASGAAPLPLVPPSARRRRLLRR